MYPTRNSPPSAAKRVRLLWTDFEGWVDIQLKILDRRRDEIFKAQELKWKSVPTKTRAKQEEHDALKAKLLREAQDAHLSKVQLEWQARLAKANLRDEDWGEMTIQEVQTIEKVLGGGADDEPPTPVVQNVVTQPQHLGIPVSNPAPPLSTAARAVNLSTSTTSSYTLVSPNEFSTDDELYEAVSSYIVPTDESEDDEHSIPVPILHGDKWGLGNHHNIRSSNHSSSTGSPDRLSSSCSSALDYFTYHPALSRPDINSAPPKRPPDLDRKSGKTRVRGPSYVGPHLSSPEESSEEEDFELFKMQTRVDKIYEFHLTAARAGVELAMAIQNDRRMRKSTKADDAAKVAAHEKQMLKLQAEKEEERKAIVAIERKKRREEIRKRSVLGEPGRAANTVPSASTAQDWEATLKRGQIVRLDAERKLFVLGKEENPEQDENQACETPRFESASDIRPAPPSQADTLRARQKLLGRGATPSGWKTKQSPSTPITSLSQWPNDTLARAPPSPDPSVVPAWMEEAFKDTSLEYSSSAENDDLQLPGAFSGSSSASTPVPPIPSGWGPKKSGPTAASLLKKVLSDPTPTPLPTSTKNKNSPSPPAEASSKVASASEPKATPAPAPLVATSASTSTSTSKKATKKGRQATQKKGGASNKVEDDVAGSPTTPTIATKPSSSAVSPKDILQRGLAHVQTDDELSSTPRPYGFMAAKRGLVADYASDVVSTPKATVRRLGEMSALGMGMGSGAASTSSSGLGALSWTGEAHNDKENGKEETLWERAMRLGKVVPQRVPEVKSGWGRVQTGKEQEPSEENEDEEEVSPWERMQRMKGQVKSVSAKTAEKAPETTNPWLRMQMANGRSQVPPSRSAEETEESPWERMQRLKAEGQVPLSKSVQGLSGENPWARGLQAAQMADIHSSMSTSKPSPPSQEEGSLRERQMKAQTHSAFSQRSATANASLSKNAVSAASAEESIWNQVMKSRSQMGERQAPAVMSQQVEPQQPSEPDEAPWERFMKQQKAASEVAGASSSKSVIHPPSAPAKTQSAKVSWGGAVDYDSPASKLAQQQQPPPAQFDGLYWTPNGGGVNHSQSWGAAGAGTQKGAKTKKPAAKVTIEEVPDEEGPGGRKGPVEKLPPDSRIILDIVEPKPSVPSTTFTNILHYGEEEEEDEEEYDTGLSSTVPTPSTAPTSPPGEVPSLDDEEWLMAAAENAKNGNWDNLLNGSGSLASDTSSRTKQVPGGWPSESSATRTAAGFQMVDSAKLHSALESVEPAPAPQSKTAAPPPKTATAPAPPVPAASKGAATSPARAPAVEEKPEPAAKPAAQNQGKGGKGKGKGKGRK
ncbi:hypothetical protein LshimejAT787_0603760 [Lyophyllum shimeji]|uniref:Uncharacterized protein n=1 Tax=Lyophyllum shimeji TaxID=47721 RepID=A0A9P3PPI5_LYOSH|nr:hypothetical protein LshimejAT787_0603760 [Lyophyllum shimeji]